MITLRIEAPHFVAGVVVDPETECVTDFAPIVKYMHGWHLERVQTYCGLKGWFVTMTIDKQDTS